MFHDQYTEHMEARLFEQWDMFDSADDDYTAVIDFLNEKNVFHSFGDGLLSLMRESNPDLSAENAIKYIENACTEHGVSKSEIGSTNTLKSWFKGGPRPKKGEDSRNAMFALAFALGLSPEKTAALFHKVYLDRAFDYRNEHELVFYHCLAHSKSWQDAKRLIDSIPTTSDVENGETIYTAVIKNTVDTLSSEDALLSYISRNKYNFAKNNLSAKESVSKLLDKAHSIAKNESSLPEYADQYRGSNRDSVSFMYEVITGFSVSGNKGTTTIFKNARLPKEIKNRFPEAGTFSKKNPTYEELRKMIVLLFSYVYWYHCQENDLSSDIDNYTEELNAYLGNSGLPLLYYGNPFDWLFLYCNLAERPLDAFREILSEVLMSDI